MEQREVLTVHALSVLSWYTDTLFTIWKVSRIIIFKKLPLEESSLFEFTIKDKRKHYQLLKNESKLAELEIGHSAIFLKSTAWNFGKQIVTNPGGGQGIGKSQTIVEKIDSRLYEESTMYMIRACSSKQAHGIVGKPSCPKSDGIVQNLTTVGNRSESLENRQKGPKSSEIV